MKWFIKIEKVTKQWNRNEQNKLRFQILNRILFVLYTQNQFFRSVRFDCNNVCTTERVAIF